MTATVKTVTSAEGTPVARVRTAVPRRPPLITGPLLVRFVSVIGAEMSSYLPLSVVPLYVKSSGSGAGAGLATGALLVAGVAAELATPRLVARAGYRVSLAVGLAHSGPAHWGYGPVFAVTAAAALLPLASVPALPGRPPASQHTGGVLAGLRHPGLVRLALVFCASTVAAGVLVTFLPLAVTTATATAALFAQPAAATAARWAAGRIGDRHGRRGCCAPGCCCQPRAWPCSPRRVCPPRSSAARPASAPVSGSCRMPPWP
jgi:hypothetical protein